MFKNQSAQFGGVARFIAVAILLLAALPALAQANLRATKIGKTSIRIKWDAVPSAAYYGVSVDGKNVSHITNTSVRSFTIQGLRPNTRYIIALSWPGGQQSIPVRTAGKPADKAGDAGKRKEIAYKPTPVTCPYLPSRVLVSGFARETQCQMVGEVVIGKTNLVQRGFIDAVDVWHYVNGGLEVCFRNNGWLVFLDAKYLQRRVMELEHYHRDGMTCGRIDGIGTVVLLERAAPPVEGDLPLFQSIPLSDCQIKLVETLFLRAQPAGEIIGLVWLNSEVPAFEINGYWYKIEFEGKTGYISRYHRKVLRGGCG